MDLQKIESLELIIFDDDDAKNALQIMAHLKDYENAIKDAQKKVSGKYKELESLLKDYYEQQTKDGTKYKIDCEYGTVSKTKSATWEYKNEDSIVNQLEVLAPELIRVKKEIDKNALKKQCEVTDDGEVLLNDELIDNLTVFKEDKIAVKIKNNS